MAPGIAVALALGIGLVAGLRSMTAPAVVAWAAHLDWINLSGSHFGFMASTWAVCILSAAALGEYVADLLPGVPARTSVAPLTARIVTGALSAACLGVASHHGIVLSATAGATGALVGAFAGYEMRRRLVKVIGGPDLAVAIPEDIIAIGLGVFLLSRFS